MAKKNARAVQFLKAANDNIIIAQSIMGNVRDIIDAAQIIKDLEKLILRLETEK